MKPHITVPGVFGLQLSRKIFTSDKQIRCCYSNSELVLLGTDAGLSVYELPNFELLHELALENPPVKIMQLRNYFLVLCEKDLRVLCLEWADGKLNQNSFLEGHCMAVNGLIVNNSGNVVTCSDDFTVRLWQGEQPFQISKILSGHTGKVKCLDAYREYVVSGSAEAEVIVWRDRKLFHRTITTSEVQSLLACLQAGYLVAATKLSGLLVFDLKALKHQKLPLLYTVKLPETNFTKRLAQIDEHFIVAVEGNHVNFIEIYMQQLIRTFTAERNIVDITPINSMVVFADQQHLYLEDLCL